MKKIDKLFDSDLFNISLRIKIMLVFILPMALALSFISYVHNQRERMELEHQAEASALRLSDVLLATLNHAMVMNDREMIMGALNEVGGNASIEEVWIVASDTTVYASTDAKNIGAKLNLKAPGCIECHQYSPAERPRAMHMWLGKEFLRVSTPIPNDKTCQTCHSGNQAHLGVFLIDLSTADIEKELRSDMIYNVVVSIVSVLCLMILAYALVQWLIVRRVDVIRAALIRLDERDFSARITARWHTRDEITQLADHINTMAENFAILQAEHEQRDRVRAQAIIDERERIARELHDGVAQFLGYLSAKIGATRMALKNKKEEIADKNLEQVEQAIHDQSSEVRSATVGLKLAGSVDRGFSANVREFVEQCNRLDDN
ncbi:MAG: histidine kinase, partial [Anaerolineales bacterium]|nr:histidine kinase [Anaerolineales bacterium]